MRLIGLLSLLIASCASASPDVAGPTAADPVEIDETFPPAIVELGVDSHGARMNGHIYLANGEGPHPTVVLLHGYPGNEKNLDLAQAIRRAGWNVLFFHYRGAWGSQGDFSYGSSIEDVASALAFLRDPANKNLRVDPAHIALIGHSMGGFMALQGGARDEGVRCVAGIAAANFGERALLAAASPEALAGFKAYTDQLVMLHGFSGDKAVGELLAAGENFDNRRLAPQLAGKHIFLIAGERDDAVDISVHERHMAAFREAGLDVKELRLDADHSFSWHRIRLAQELIAWLDDGCR